MKSKNLLVWVLPAGVSSDERVARVVGANFAGVFVFDGIVRGEDAHARALAAPLLI